MIKVENVDVWGFEHAVRGMRNPMNSWDKSDSEYKVVHVDQFSLEETKEFIVGEKDLDLMKRLYKAGTEHRKYLRQIIVSMDITAPLYWWKEMDTYKVGTVANSCSTMHKIAAKEFDINDFSHEHLCPIAISSLKTLIRDLNLYRDTYLAPNDSMANNCLMDDYKLNNKKEVWWQLIQLLPSSYNQKRTITMNYENVVTIIRQRTGHKLDEWNEFVKILRSLPYIEEITEVKE